MKWQAYHNVITFNTLTKEYSYYLYNYEFLSKNITRLVGRNSASIFFGKSHSVKISKFLFSDLPPPANPFFSPLLPQHPLVLDDRHHGDYCVRVSFCRRRTPPSSCFRLRTKRIDASFEDCSWSSGSCWSLASWKTGRWSRSCRRGSPARSTRPRDRPGPISRRRLKQKEKSWCKIDKEIKWRARLIFMKSRVYGTVTQGLNIM